MMSERQQIEFEAETRGWSVRRGGNWTSMARNEFRLAIDWSDAWVATAAELSISGGSTVARRSWRSSSITPGQWALNLLRAPLMSEDERLVEEAATPEPVTSAQEFIDAVAAAVRTTAETLTRLSQLLGTCTPRVREHLTDTTIAYARELDQQIQRYYLDTATAGAVGQLRPLMEETRQ